ncbi:MAG TPA: hypothetical protein VJZ26_10140 [Blastocatellia bacterium]|nr:hypothetical protein [Blastocatellia bacterium]
MREVRINRFETRYRLPQSLLAESQRLDHIRSLVIEEALELALERIALPEDGELCIRRIYAPVRLRLNSPNPSLALDWSMSLSEEIERAYSSGRDSNIVFYHSRRQALMDLAIGVARGDLSRAWAWRQLGIWRAGEQAGEGEAVFELARALCAEPEMIIPALRVMAEAEVLHRVFMRLTAGQLKAIATSALSQARVSDELLEPDADEASPLNTGSGLVASSRAMRDALRVLKGSRLLRLFVSSRPLAGESDELWRAVAALAALDFEPALLRTNAAPTVVRVIARAISSAGTEVTDVTDAQEEFDERPHGGERGELSNSQAGPNKDQEPIESKVIDLTKRAFTRFGGLLFLLGVIEDLNLPEEIPAHPSLGLRGLPWVMRRLALALTGAEPYDAAVLAFAGLLPGSTLDAEDQDSPNEIEDEAVIALASRIVEQLRVRLERPDESADTLLEFVCHRRAQVVAEPGWVDVKFSLEEVSTEIRRAGLDLNPGYLPWLGLVVRFVYE